MSIEDLLKQWREAVKERERLNAEILWLTQEIEKKRTKSKKEAEE